MQLIDGRPVYAATDLVAFLACEHLTQLERAALAELIKRPMRDDPELDIIRKRGFEHERRFLDDLVASGRTTATIQLDGSIADDGERLRAAQAETVAAMRAGSDVIYQATFFDGTWRGHADFLLRVDDESRPSAWGSWHYEVADTKLARHVKASAVLQICTYVDLLEALQGVRPEWMHVALGGSAREVERLRVDDFLAYFRSVRRRFLATTESGDPPLFPPRTYPEPVEHCDVCRWAAECAAQRRADDHLSLVAGISARQRRALAARGVDTLAGLGRLELPLDPPLEGTSAGALTRVREQARIQLEGRLAGDHRYELLLPGPGAELERERGLATLPEPSPSDLFFDIEGDPYAFDDGLDYLFGVLEMDGTFHAFWSRDERGEFSPAGERHAFEQLVDFVTERHRADPTLHVYHYAPYEPTALKRLMGRYGTREDEIDRLLRGGVLVDLLRAVRQSLRASVESYSIKKLEPFYGFEREVDLRDAGSSIVAFEEWLELGEGDRPASDHLDRIERYNRDDVISNRRLRDWLEERRVELGLRTGQEVPRPADLEPELPEDLTRERAHVDDLAARLTLGVAPDRADRSSETHARWLLAQLLGWHRREDKSMWWQFFEWMKQSTPAELVEESEPIGRLEPLELIETDAKGRETWRYRFPDQELDLGPDGVYDPAKAHERPNDSPFTWGAGDVVRLNLAAGTVDLRRPSGEPHPESIVPLNWFRTQDHQESLIQLAEWVVEHGIDGDGPHEAARALLLGRPPRLGQADGAPIRRPSESDLEAAVRSGLSLDRTTLPIQGPPGSGKTYNGARMIVALLARGKRVGITATSHKVIGNLIREVQAAAADPATVGALTADVRIIQHGPADKVVEHDDVVRAKDGADVRARLDAGVSNLAAGTTWLWASRRMIDSVDVLVVDEAGQISLANVVAVARATSSLVLLGDPQQLDQPLRGSHPPGADRSALAHILDGQATMPPDRGLFLERTWRLHPDLCAYTSEAFYDDRLEPEPDLGRQRLATRVSLVAGTGPRLLEVPTAGADNESPDEAEAVAALARSIVDGGTTWTDRKGTSHPVTWDQVLIVAPYNAQVAAISRLLPAGARVGTVDKFQGQEAPISIYSMTSSTPELAPRGLEFLYSRNRLNVATSRARCIAVVALSPELLHVRARNPAQMRLANALCRLAELATPAVGLDPPRTSSGGRARPAVLTLGL
ncbi:MAG TPA: TM0106 family RecB-like putative nuclease [Candidatus Limnocylindrales bacterium]|nr:TM0106 family RecB-like putative nuclease [Candidatus Limnocylindrales bacterium]